MPTIRTEITKTACAFAAIAGPLAASVHAQAPKPLLARPRVAPAQGIPQHAPAISVARPTRVSPPSHAGAFVTHPTAEHEGRSQKRVEAAHPIAVRSVSGTGGTIVVVEGAGGAPRPRLHAALDYLIAANEAMRSGAANAVATEHVRQALHELSQSQSNPTFQGHRQLAIDRSIRAVHLLEGGSTFDEPTALTRDAIDDLRFCVSAP